MKANCVECGVALVARYGWQELTEERREEYAAMGIRPRAGLDMCDKHYQAARRGGRKTYSNEMMHHLFWQHDPGHGYTDSERFEAVSQAIGRSVQTVQRAAQRGGWDLNTPPKPRPDALVLYVDGNGKEQWLKPVTMTRN